MLRCRASYLDDVVEESGMLFSFAIEKGYNLKEFICFYMSSRLRELIDMSSPIHCTMLGAELLEYLEKNEGLNKKVQIDHSTKDTIKAQWLGEFYALAQWELGKPSFECLKALPPEKIIAVYNTLHDLDMRLAVNRMLGKSN